MKSRCASSVLTTILLLAGLTATVNANPVAISGNAGASGGNEASISLSGPGLDILSSTLSYANDVFACTIGTFCDMTLTVPSALNFEGAGAAIEFAGSRGSFLAQNANLIGGSLTFSGGAMIPSTFATGDEVSFPVTVSGSIQGYSVGDCPGTCVVGSPLWSFNISGTGEATFGASFNTGTGQAVFDFASYTFAGTATPTPEPSSLLLLATGMMGLTGVARRLTA